MVGGEGGGGVSIDMERKKDVSWWEVGLIIWTWTLILPMTFMLMFL